MQQRTMLSSERNQGKGALHGYAPQVDLEGWSACSQTMAAAAPPTALAPVSKLHSCVLSQYLRLTARKEYWLIFNSS